MAKDYTVLNIKPVTRLTSTGMYLKMYEVQAITTNGMTFSVELPQVGFSKEDAAIALQAEAEKLEATLAL